MFSPDSFSGTQLVDGMSIASVTLADKPIENLFGKRAFGRTRIGHREFYIIIAAEISDSEKSVTLYHEVLESAILVAWQVPPSLTNFGEGDFEREGYAMHERFGPVSPTSLVAMLQFYGFGETLGR